MGGREGRQARACYARSSLISGQRATFTAGTPGTTLEIGDGWANGDSRRWNGEMRKFVLYSEPKDAGAVASLYSDFQALSGGGGGH